MGIELICCMIDGQPKIVLPSEMEDGSIDWYHFVCGHAGSTRLNKTLKQLFYFPGMKAKVEAYTETCEQCQKNKNPGPGYGHVPPRNNTAQHFEAIAVDLMGPWKLDIPNIGTIKIFILSVIDTATALCELVRIDNKSSQYIAHKTE